METKANHVVIGAFTLATMFGLFAFALWIVKSEIDQEFAEYDVLFEGAVNGLGKAGAVSYKGVKVGEVARIGINAANPNQIRVHLKVDAATPIYRDSIAKIEYQGVTGVGFVQISGGTAQAGELPLDPETGYPVIPSEDSDLQAIFATAPEIMTQVTVLLDKISAAVSDENVAAIGETINNINTITGSFANRGPEIEALIANVSAISGDLKETTAGLSRVMASIEKAAEGADETINKELRATITSVGKLSDEVALAVEAARPAIEGFSAGGAQDLSRLLVELRSVSRSLDRLVGRLESDAAQTLLGDGETR
ncbi:MAG: MlaD family protein [Alphaproteobacteria bacterium]